MSQSAPIRQRIVLSAEDVGQLAEAGSKPAETLMNVVALIATQFQTDVCSAIPPPNRIVPIWSSPQRSVSGPNASVHYDSASTRAWPAS